MGSNVEKGQYTKLKTKIYYQNCGYEVVLIEQLRTIRRGNRIIYQKRDTLGADMICVNDHETLLVNSVLGNTNVSKHIAEFLTHKRGNCKRVVAIWTPYAREPVLRFVDNEIKKGGK